MLRGRHGGRVAAAIFVAPSLPIASPIPEFAHAVRVFDDPQAAYQGWLKFNRQYWRQDWPDFVGFFMGRCLTEPDSAVEINENVEMGRCTTAEVITAAAEAPGLGCEEILALAAVPSPPRHPRGRRCGVAGRPLNPRVLLGDQLLTASPLAARSLTAIRSLMRGLTIIDRSMPAAQVRLRVRGRRPREQGSRGFGRRDTLPST